MKKIIKGYFLENGAKLYFESDRVNRLILCFKRRRVFLKRWLREEYSPIIEKEGDTIFFNEDGREVDFEEVSRLWKGYQYAFSCLLFEIFLTFSRYPELGEDIYVHLKKSKKEEEFREVCIDISGEVEFSYPEPIKRL